MENAQNGKQINQKSTLPTGNILIRAGLSVIFSLFLPFCLSGRFSEEQAGFVAVLFALLAAVDLFLGSASPKYPILCLVLGVAAAFLSQTIFVGVCILTALLSINDGALALAFIKPSFRPIAILAVPAISFTASYFLTGGVWLTAFTSIVFFPAALTLAVTTVKKTSRTSAICAISASLVIPILIIAVCAFAQAFGSLSADTLRNFVGDFRENSVNALIQSYDAMTETYAQTYGESASALLAGGFSTEYVDSLVAGLINLAPALIIICTNAVGFLTQGLNTSRLRRMRANGFVTFKTVSFELSIFAPIVLLLSFAITYFTAEGTSQAELTAFIASENIFSILEPALALYGLKRLFKPRAKFPMFIPFIVLLLALLFASAYFIKICAFWGAFSRIFEAVASKIHSEQ